VSDTVGFISDLPTMLVAAFRATLEEVIEADLILHVRDIAHADSDAQARDVEKVLRDLDVDPNDRHRLIEVWNKIDRLDAESRARVLNVAARQSGEERPILLSALTGEGIDSLIAVIDSRLAQSRTTFDLLLDPADGAGVSWLHRNTEVMAKSMRPDGQYAVTVRVDPTKAEIVRRKYAGNALTTAPRAHD
jgi:GTP-binding protein HflX